MGIALSGDGGVDIAEDVVEFADDLLSVVDDRFEFEGFVWGEKI